MADNFDVTAGAGTTIRAVEKTAKKAQVVVLDLGGAGAESLLTTTLPVSVATAPALVAGTALIGKVGIDQATANANEIVVKSGTVTTVSAVTKVNEVVPGVAATDLGKAVDTAMGATDTGVLAVGVQKATAVQLGADGDITPLQIDTTGHLYVNPGSPTVKGNGLSVTVTLTVTNGAYAIADVVGGLITFANAVSGIGKHAIVNSIKLAGVVAIPYELWFFNADLITPRADNETFNIVVADEPKCLGVVPIAAADYFAAQSAFNIATVRGVGLEVKAGAAVTSIYAYLKATAVTSPGTNTVYLTVDFEYLD